MVLNMLAEASTTEISKKKIPSTFEENKKIARQGGEVAGAARGSNLKFSSIHGIIQYKLNTKIGWAHSCAFKILIIWVDSPYGVVHLFICSKII